MCGISLSHRVESKKKSRRVIDIHIASNYWFNYRYGLIGACNYGLSRRVELLIDCCVSLWIVATCYYWFDCHVASNRNLIDCHVELWIVTSRCVELLIVRCYVALRRVASDWIKLFEKIESNYRLLCLLLLVSCVACIKLNYWSGYLARWVVVLYLVDCCVRVLRQICICASNYWLTCYLTLNRLLNYWLASRVVSRCSASRCCIGMGIGVGSIGIGSCIGIGIGSSESVFVIISCLVDCCLLWLSCHYLLVSCCFASHCTGSCNIGALVLFCFCIDILSCRRYRIRVDKNSYWPRVRIVMYASSLLHHIGELVYCWVWVLVLHHWHYHWYRIFGSNCIGSGIGKQSTIRFMRNEPNQIFLL